MTSAVKQAGLYLTGVPQWLEAFHLIAEEDALRIAELEAERDNAWTELREIRSAISANPEESTLDEVVKLRQQLATIADKVREECASTAWLHYMDVCKKHGHGPNVERIRDFCSAEAIRAMRGRPR